MDIGHVKLISRSGTVIKIRNTPSTDIHIFSEIWINEEYVKKGFDIKEEDIVIDIGSHIGLFTLWASQNCKKGKIICVEPEPQNFRILKENINRNNISNVICYNLACSNELKKIQISHNREDSASHSIFKKNKEFFESETITIKNIFSENQIGKCDLLKMDCEGAEYEILLNLKKEFFEKIEKICLEYHKNDELKLDENMLIRHLQNQKYTVILKELSKKTGLIFAKKL